MGRTTVTSPPRPPILAPLRDNVNAIQRFLDAAEVSTQAAERLRNLRLAIRESIRTVKYVASADFAKSLDWSRSQLPPKPGLLDAIADPAMFDLFVESERRLLTDLGLAATLVERLMNEFAVLQDWVAAWTSNTTTTWLPLAPEPPSFQQCIDGLSQAELLAVDERDHDGLRRKVLGALQVGGGGIVIVANQLTAISTAPITAGLSMAGASLSGALGGAVLGRGVTKLLNAP
jgi:hypothetical protein